MNKPTAVRTSPTTVNLTRMSGETVSLTKQAKLTHIAYTVRGDSATVTFHGSAQAAEKALKGEYHRNADGPQGVDAIA